jgi:hypothetical protein
MTFSGGGRGPHIWVPRRSGLGQISVNGGIAIPADTGTQVGLYKAVVAGGPAGAPAYVNTISPGAQGYVTQAAADKARSDFASDTGIQVPWVPIVDPTSSSGRDTIKKWAGEQAAAWAGPVFQGYVQRGRDTLAKARSGLPNAPDISIRNPLSDDETVNWCEAYIFSHPNLLTNPTPEAAVAMMQSFVLTNCGQIGLPPELIAAGQMIHNLPTTVDGAESWALALGSSYMSRFGIPIITNTDPTAFLHSCGRAAMLQIIPGTAFSMCELTVDAISTGSISLAGVEGIIIGACGTMCAAIGQLFGLPAPIGAILGNIIGGALVPVLADALGFGPTDSEKLSLAQQAARQAAAAGTAVCTDLAATLWVQYQLYWQKMQGSLDGLMQVNDEWLRPYGRSQGISCTAASGDGIRLFPEMEAGGNTLDFVYDQNGNPVPIDAKAHQYMRYPYPVTRSCVVPAGCPYLQFFTDPIVVRDSYDYSRAALGQARIPNITEQSPSCDALSSLAFWRARRYVTPFQVVLAMKGSEYAAAEDPRTVNRCHRRAGKPNMWKWDYDCVEGQFADRNVTKWDSYEHSDKEELQKIGTVAWSGGTEVGGCSTPEWGRWLHGSLQQAAAASALVQRDVARTVSMATSQYSVQQQMAQAADVAATHTGNEWLVASAAIKRDAVRKVAANAASFRTAVKEARRRGQRRGDALNYGLLAVGGGALAGWAAARMMRR